MQDRMGQVIILYRADEPSLRIVATQLHIGAMQWIWSHILLSNSPGTGIDGSFSPVITFRSSRA